MSKMMLNNRIEKLEKKIKNRPNDVSSMAELAYLLMNMNQIYPAVNLLKKIFSINPTSQVANDLGVGYIMTAHHRLAEEALLGAISLDPNNGDAHFNLATVYSFGAQDEKAIAHYRKCYELDPKARPGCLAAIAMIKEAKGMVSEAFEDLKLLVDEGYLDDKYVVKYFASIVVQHRDYCKYVDTSISAILSLLERGQVSALEVKSFYFLLGNLYCEKNDLENAFDSFSRAHSHSSHIYSVEGDELLADNIIDTWGATLAAEVDTLPPSKQTMIFIVGLPRSGSTLLEQILSCNSELTDLGECDYFDSSVRSALSSSEDKAHKGGRPLSVLEAQQVRRTYRQMALKTKKLSSFVSDKTLPNYYFVGQILQVFPDAKIIWSLRDPRDCCLSIYTHDFSGGHEYRHDLSQLARHANLQYKLMSFWKDKYPDSIHVAQYEKLVGSPEENIRELVDFCGFEWEETYLSPQDSSRRVATASYNQIKKPLYSTSVGRWLPAKEFLQPLLDELEIPKQYDI